MMKHFFRYLLLSTLLVALLAGCHSSGSTKEEAKSSAASSSPSGRFEVVSVSPQEEIPASVRYPSIQIQFSEPVVALKKLGEPSDRSDFVSITPAVKGVFRWYGTSLLSFDCSEAIAPQKVYTVKVNPDAKSVNGNAITGELEYSFHPENLRITSITAGYGEIKQGTYIDSDNVPMDAAKDILVNFNFPVNASVVAKGITVESSGGKSFSFTAAQESPASIRLSLASEPEDNVAIEVKLSQGAMADEDCYQTTEASSESFHTLHPFAIEYFDNEPYYMPDSYSNPVTFTFSTMLDQDGAEELARHITNNLGFTVTKDNVAVNGRQLIVYGLPVNFGSTYLLMLDKGIADKYGRTLGKDASYSVEVPEARSFAYFKNSGLNILEAQFAPKLVFEHQNIKAPSQYTVSAVADARGKKAAKNEKTVTMNPSEIPQNMKVIEAVDVTPFLEQAGDEYHGTVNFDADITYQYKELDWSTDEKVVKTGVHSNSQTVQVTDLGVTMRYGYNRAAILVTSLKNGRPVANADVAVYTVNDDSVSSPRDVVVGSHRQLGKGRTNADGFAVVEFPKGVIHALTYRDNIFVEAKTDNDRVIFRPDSHNLWRAGVYNTGSPREAEDVEMVTFIFTDRGLYKPGETVTFRGIDRNLSCGEYEPYKGSYSLELNDGTWRPKVYYTSKGTTTENGSFWGKFTLPEDIEPGEYRIAYKRKVPGRSDEQIRSCTLQVQFFERLRFEVNASVPAITYYAGDDIAADLKANYLGGGSLAGCGYEASWSREKTYFSLSDPAFEDFSFGPEQGYDWGSYLNSSNGTLNDEGRASVTQKTGGEKILGAPYRYRMQAGVTDSGNQLISTSTTAMVHPAKYYIGLRRTGNAGFPKKGDKVTFDYVCVTPDGTAPLAGDLPSQKKMKVELLREEWKQVQQVSWNGQINTRYEREMVSEHEEEVALSGTATAKQFSVEPPQGGSYIVRVSSTDSRGREVITESQFYVTSSDWYWYNRNSDSEITMTPNKAEYQVGDTAQILMQSQLPKGSYLLTVEREGLLSQEIRHIDAPTSVIEVPIKENYIPVMYVTLSSYSVRTGAPQNDFNTPDLDKPKGHFGVATLNVSTKLKRFDIDIKTDKPSYRPGETARIDIHAASNGKPLSNAEVTLMAVDRGVIDLINYHVPDPVAYFYSQNRFSDCVAGGDSRAYLIDPVTYEIKNLIGGDEGDNDGKMQERKNFDPTAVFVPNLVTDANGNASYTFKLPDSLTAYRITAVGVSANNFALSEGQMNVANPVSVRTALPRQLRLNDTGEVGVVISNIDADAHNVSIELALYEGLDRIGEQSEDDVQKLPGKAEIVGGASKSLSVPAEKTQSLMFSIKAKRAGWICIEYTVKSDVVNEKVLLPLQIEKPYIYETVTTVGEVRSEENKGAASVEEKLVIPAGAEDGMGELYVQLDPTRLGVLREAISYVFHYPYGCLEQRSAAILPLVAFDKYIKIFGLESEVKNPKSVVAKTLKEFAKSQQPDGGFPYWPGSSYTNAYVSMRIAEIVGLAKAHGISTGGIDADRLGEYLSSYGNQFVSAAESGSTWSYYTAAHAYYAASCLGASISMENVKKISDSADAGPETLALCGLIYLNKDWKGEAKETGTKLRRFISQTTRGASFTNVWERSYGGYWSFFNDESEVFALSLQLFTQLSAADELNQHLVYELLQLQKASHGYWTSTAATSRVLIALRTYIESNKLDDLNFSAEVLLNKKKLAEGKFKGVAAEAVEQTSDFREAPLKSMPRDKELPLVFSKDGTGTLYYTASMKYAIPTAEQTARDEGLCVFTEIVDVKTGERVTADTLEAGKVYRETLYLSSTRNREYVAVRAPIPAGCEIMNAAFVTTGNYPEPDAPEPDAEEEDEEDYESYWRDYNWGLSYQGIYDSEVQYFWDYFPTGFQKVDFLFRAVRAGEYNTPSATAECMYQSEIFGRSNGKVWKIK